MPEALKYVIDAGAGAGAALFLALLVVLFVDLAFFSTAGPGKDTLPNVKVIGGDKRDRKKLKLAVTPTGKFDKPGTKEVDLWDDMGKLLNDLGEGYKYDDITEEQIIKKHEDKKLNDYDVIFLTCHPNIDPVKLQRLAGPLVSYVANGGILYASDWRYDTIATAFPDLVVEKLKGEGADQKVQADVVDRDLQKALDGSEKIDLKFDLPEWKTAAFGGPRVQTLIQGKYKKYKSKEEPTAPLMVRFQWDKGTVFFTSFHNEKQNSRTEKLLLQYVVSSLVGEAMSVKVKSSLENEGFKPQRSNLLSNAKEREVKKEYQNDQVCTLRFTLAFHEEGKLRFNLKSPDGLQFTKDCESTVGFEVPNAAKGTWTYTVTALTASANLQFTVTVGEKK